MHRIDADGHVANQFSDGDQSLGILGTKVDAAWLNAVQEEICNLLAARGVTLAKGTNTQLRDAMVGAAAAWANIYATGSGAYLNDHLGIASLAFNGTKELVVTLSKAMANDKYAVIPSSKGELTAGASTDWGYPFVTSKTTTSFKVQFRDEAGVVLDISTWSFLLDLVVHGDLA